MALSPVSRQMEHVFHIINSKQHEGWLKQLLRKQSLHVPILLPVPQQKAVLKWSRVVEQPLLMGTLCDMNLAKN